MMQVNPFKGLGDVQIGYGGEFDKPGQTIQRIDSVKLCVNRKNIAYVAIEKTILVVLQQGDAVGGKPQAPGDVVKHLIMTNNDSFLKNFKRFVSGCWNLPAEQIDENAGMAICDESQPMAGMIVEVHARLTATKENKPFTMIDYKGQVPVAKLRPLLSKDVIVRFFSKQTEGDVLDQMARAEAHLAQQAAQAAGQ